MKISIVGSGNVATNLAINLKDAGHRIIQIAGTNAAGITSLAYRVNATAVNELQQIDTSIDLLLLCVKDQALEQVANALPKSDTLVVHTSGSVAIDVLNIFRNHGVFYPLQTFSKEHVTSLNQVPFCIEANSKTNEELLLNLAHELGAKHLIINSQQRKQCHVAAVFANNFSNHMYAIAESILQKENIPFEVLRPLIQETVRKIEFLSPKDAQTGPARRNDQAVMADHLNHLNSDKLEKIYRFVSESIASYYTSK
jgi:predicted short-subunit dehydrogenase-like oxidoreductase (DUF2520 family)